MAILVALSPSVGCKMQEARNPGSDPTAPGFVSPSSLDMRAGPPEPLDPADLAGIQARGVELYYQEVGMRLAFEVGLPRVGTSNVAALLPLATVDEGAHSGQVEFWRWRPEQVPESGQLDAKLAQRWLVVPFLLRPDRVLENEQFNQDMDEKSEEYYLVSAIITAANELAAKYPGAQWHMHPYREAVRDGTRRIRSVRVYMFGTGDRSPDLEVVVAEPKGKKDPFAVTEVIVVHQPGDISGGKIRTRLPSPGPLTVARVKALGLDAGDVSVAVAEGSSWTINAETGAMQGPGGAADEATDDASGGE